MNCAYYCVLWLVIRRLLVHQFRSRECCVIMDVDMISCPTFIAHR